MGQYRGVCGLVLPLPRGRECPSVQCWNDDSYDDLDLSDDVATWHGLPETLQSKADLWGCTYCHGLKHFDSLLHENLVELCFLLRCGVPIGCGPCLLRASHVCLGMVPTAQGSR